MTIEFQLIDNILQECSPATLWCVDENIGHFSPQKYAGHIISNRFDICQNLQKRFASVVFNDFDFTGPMQSLEKIVFRIAKEKALNLHIIQQAFAHLDKGHSLLLIGYKNEGINSLHTYINDHFAAETIVHKHKAQLQCLEIIVQETTVLPADNYAKLQTVNIDKLDFFSKPGVFGWNKLDKGSHLLMQNVAQHLTVGEKQQVLDLGCGYGYLSIIAWQSGFRHIDATDNNAAAIIACQANFKHLGIDGTVFADNHAEHCRKKYDLVLCNPPFHQGFDHSKNLIETFVRQAHLLLKPHGQACFVTNQFIGIEKIAQPLFAKCELLDKSDGFKVFLFKKS